MKIRSRPASWGIEPDITLGICDTWGWGVGWGGWGGWVGGLYPKRPAMPQIVYLHFETIYVLANQFFPFITGVSLKMISRKIKGDALKIAGSSHQPPPPELLSPTPLICTLNMWTLCLLHSCKLQPFPPYLHTMLQGKDNFPFYLGWVHRKWLYWLVFGLSDVCEMLRVKSLGHMLRSE